MLVDGDSPGLTRTELRKMGWWASDTARLHFDQVWVPVDHLIGGGSEEIMKDLAARQLGI